MVDIKKSKTIVSRNDFEQRVVICGSMSYYGDMLNLKDSLRDKSIPSIVPFAEDKFINNLSNKEFNAFKRKVSFQYITKIRDLQTLAILVVNKDKHGISDYIGPNTFAEIAVAFAQRKKIFLLQGIPEQYEDELQAWGVFTLDGSLSAFFNYYKAETEIKQMSFFDEKSSPQQTLE